jgi:hypothetical protein
MTASALQSQCNHLSRAGIRSRKVRTLRRSLPLAAHITRQHTRRNVKRDNKRRALSLLRPIPLAMTLLTCRSRIASRSTVRRQKPPARTWCRQGTAPPRFRRRSRTRSGRRWRRCRCRRSSPAGACSRRLSRLQRRSRCLKGMPAAGLKEGCEDGGDGGSGGGRCKS